MLWTGVFAVLEEHSGGRHQRQHRANGGGHGNAGQKQGKKRHYHRRVAKPDGRLQKSARKGSQHQPEKNELHIKPSLTGGVAGIMCRYS
ncbi:hypothetical protein SDC9_161693 [bioreactor metagenome]|uniref:Uncharacterized protein n=1 Tax=bioreactor metagenome TaxID=1076179 RepID=A0A645FL23_9ZZZZ